VGGLVVQGTEFLSLFNQLTTTGLALYWGVLTAFLLVVLLIYHRPKNLFRPSFLPISPGDVGLLSAILFVLLTLLVIALCSAPNNWDSHTYHMSRVAHWIQNKNVKFFATSNLRQLFYAPFAEYNILHLQILSHSDRFANSVQWFAMLGSVIGSSFIVKILNGSRRAQILASLIAVTIPMGMLQSTSTQNDYVAAFFVICFVVFLLLSKQKWCWLHTLGLGMSLGLGLFTKGTVLIYTLPFIIWMVVRLIKRMGRNSFRHFSIIIIVVAALQMNFIVRSFDAIHEDPSSFKSEFVNVTNAKISIPILASNVIRNTGLHLGSPFASLNRFVENAVRQIHLLLKINIADPRSTFARAVFLFPGHPFHEDHAGNLLHLILIIGLSLLFLLQKKYRRDSEFILYFASLCLAILIFNLTFKWQPWGSRLQLPLFVLFAPFLGIMLTQFKNKQIPFIAGIILFCCCQPWLFANQSRPLIGSKSILKTKRWQQYFANNPGFQFSYEAVTQAVKESSCRHIGLLLSGDSWEYPTWSRLEWEENDPLQLEHVNVNNASKKYQRQDFDPCLIIADETLTQRQLSVGSNRYVLINKWPFTNLLQKDTDGRLLLKTNVSTFFKIIKLMNETRQVRLNGTPAKKENQINRIVSLYRQALNATALVDPPLLNELYSSLGNHFEQKLRKGLQTFLQGIHEQNEEKIGEGQNSLQEWQEWWGENKDEIMTRVR